MWARWRWNRGAELAARLDEAADILAARTAGTEPDFVALGEDLRSLFGSANELAQMIDQTTGRLHAILTGHHFSGADGLVAATLRSVRAGIRGVDDEMEMLAGMMEGLAAMDPRLARMRRICVLLQSTAVSFAMESSRSGERQQAFGSFVDEIRALALRIAAVEEKVDQELTKARSEGTARVRELSGGLEAMRDLAGQLERTCVHAAAEIQNGLDRIDGLMNATSGRSAALRQQAEGAVFNLQFGDITRQKNEHIVTALREASGALRRHGRGAGHHGAAAVEQSLAIQMGQLNMVCGELDSAQRQLSQAFAQMAGTAAELAAPLRERDTAGGSTEPERLRTLKTDLDQLLDLDGRKRELRSRVDETAEQAFTAAERLAVQMEEVQSINHEMHLLALNAIVKTAALGSGGATLEVLAMQVQILYGEADTVVSEIVAQAARLRNRDARMAAAPGAAPEDDGAHHRLEEGVQQVREAFEAFEQMAAAALERTGGQGAWLSAAKGKLGALGSFAGELRGLAGSLGEIREALAPACRPLKDRKIEADSAVETRYTMQSERDVHGRIAAERSTGAARDGVSMEALAEETGDRSGPAVNSSAKDSGPAADSNIPSAETTGVKNAENCFGGNVDLF